MSAQISAEDFLCPAREMGFDFWAGVPCSFLKPFINYIIDADGLTYVSSANEGDAVATASGAALTGVRAAVMMQNSGLGNAVSPLSSLNWVFRLPVLLIVTLRGDPEGQDEPQHGLMGRITTQILETLDIPWQWFPRNASDIPATLKTATEHMDRVGLPYALVMRKGTVASHDLQSKAGFARANEKSASRVIRDSVDLPSRREILEQVVSHTSATDSIVIGSTGYNGRELYAVKDRPNHLYMVGSMGCAASLGLGLSLARPELKTVVCDGDGAALMRMGNLATVGSYATGGFKHLLLDNGRHESTGGQATVSPRVNFADVADACDYAAAEEYAGAGHVGRFLGQATGPALLHIRTRPGVTANLPRPEFSPGTVKQRLMQHFGFDAAWRDATG